MDLQATLPISDNELPYEPIKFVYTETIGSVLQKFKEIVDPYTWTYEDMLDPKILNNPSKVEYYLFHVAPIYNWLRKVDSNILANYISLPQKGGNFSTQNKPTFGVQKGQQYKKFDNKIFSNEIKHYASQWQIVKLCTCAKIKIITTKMDQTATKGSKALIKQPISNKEPQIRCSHLIKKQKFTSQYVLNNFTPSNLKLQCPKVYCDDCQQSVNVKAQITKYPFAPYFSKFYGKQFILNENTSTKITYQLMLVYTSENTYIKTSGGVWYEVSKQKTSIVSFEKIQIKTGIFFVYQQSTHSNKILRKAEPMKIKQNAQKKLQQLSQAIDEEDSYDLQQKLHQNLQKEKMKAKDNTPKSFPTPDKVLNQTQNVNENNQDEDEQLEDMTKNPLPIVMKKKNTDKQLFKEYKKTVQGLLPKLKQKDAYQKEYDKGKTKKIHKNRQQFRTADFFKLYTDIKGKTHNSQQNKNDRQNDNQPHEDRKQSHDENKPYKQKDEQYNEVYQARRAQRNHRGNFNRSGGSFRGNRNDGGHRPRGGHRDDRNNGNSHSRGGYSGDRNNGGHRSGGGHGGDRNSSNNRSRGGHSHSGKFNDRKPFNKGSFKSDRSG